MCSEKISNDTLIIKNGQRVPVVELKNGHCNVKTLQLSISKKVKFGLIIDLLLIGIMPIFCLGCVLFMKSKSIVGIVMAVVCASFLSVIWILNTINDFRNWFYTMNKQLEKMGEWYLEDCININLINAGSKVCSQMVEEERKQNIESTKSQNKQDICA